MFPSDTEQRRAPRPWRAALRSAAELVVAFATLDAYPSAGSPHASSAAHDAPLFDLDGDVWSWPDGPRRDERAAPAARRRGHGRPSAAPAVCLHAGGRAGSARPAPRRSTHA